MAMVRTLSLLAIAGGLLLAGLPARAHHPISEVYNDQQLRLLEGEVESFLFGNPHSLLYLRVTDGDGATRTWAVEWTAADRLARAGLDGAALSRGDAVAVCGHPGRDPAVYRLYLLNIARRTAAAGSASNLRPALCAREATPAIADLGRPQ